VIVGFLFIIGLVGLVFYIVIIQSEVPGAVEQRLGVLEALPEDVGKWKVDDTSEDAKDAISKGLRREVRIWHDPNAGVFRKNQLVRQVRYRNAATNEIVRVEPEEVIRRKRVKQ
jgi:hypothetical protein